MCHENNGKELRGDQSSKRHSAQEIFHRPPPVCGELDVISFAVALAM
jgi:hypothetical protein